MTVDLDHLRAHGYVVVPQAVEPEHVHELLEVLREVTGFDVDDPKTWEWSSFSAPIWNHQAQWDVRQHPRLHGAFAAAYGQDALMTGLEGIGVKPPEKVAATRAAAALPIHLDRDPREPRPVFQGVLYLTDVAPEQGAFTCVPGVFEDLEGWLERHPDVDWNDIDTEGHDLLPIPGNAGDLVLFDSRLPHGNAANLADSPRVVQYLGYWPPGLWGDTPQDTAELYRTGVANPAFRGRPGWDVPNPWPPAELSPLGRKLAGVDAW